MTNLEAFSEQVYRAGGGLRALESGRLAVMRGDDPAYVVDCLRRNLPAGAFDPKRAYAARKRDMMQSQTKARVKTLALAAGITIPADLTIIPSETDDRLWWIGKRGRRILVNTLSARMLEISVGLAIEANK